MPPLYKLVKVIGVVKEVKQVYEDLKQFYLWLRQIYIDWKERLKLFNTPINKITSSQQAKRVLKAKENVRNQLQSKLEAINGRIEILYNRLPENVKKKDTIYKQIIELRDGLNQELKGLDEDIKKVINKEKELSYGESPVTNASLKTIITDTLKKPNVTNNHQTRSVAKFGTSPIETKHLARIENYLEEDQKNRIEQAETQQKIGNYFEEYQENRIKQAETQQRTEVANSIQEMGIEAENIGQPEWVKGKLQNQAAWDQKKAFFKKALNNKTVTQEQYNKAIENTNKVYSAKQDKIVEEGFNSEVAKYKEKINQEIALEENFSNVKKELQERLAELETKGKQDSPEYQAISNSLVKITLDEQKKAQEEVKKVQQAAQKAEEKRRQEAKAYAQTIHDEVKSNLTSALTEAFESSDVSGAIKSFTKNLGASLRSKFIDGLSNAIMDSGVGQSFQTLFGSLSSKISNIGQKNNESSLAMNTAVDVASSVAGTKKSSGSSGLESMTSGLNYTLNEPQKFGLSKYDFSKFGMTQANGDNISNESLPDVSELPSIDVKKLLSKNSFQNKDKLTDSISNFGFDDKDAGISSTFQNMLTGPMSGKNGTPKAAGGNFSAGNIGNTAMGAVAGAAAGGMGTGAMLGSAIGTIWGPVGSMVGGMLGGLLDNKSSSKDMTVSANTAKMNVDFAQANFKTVTLPSSYMKSATGTTKNTNSVAPVINIHVAGNLQTEKSLSNLVKSISETVYDAKKSQDAKWASVSVNGVGVAY